VRLGIIGSAAPSNNAALYRRQANGTWTPEMLPLSWQFGTTLAFDAQGKPHVLGWEHRSDGVGPLFLRYAHRL